MKSNFFTQCIHVSAPCTLPSRGIHHYIPLVGGIYTHAYCNFRVLSSDMPAAIM
jgi:hypothetical protein